MKILVLSDSHNGFSFGKFLSTVNGADIVVHLGDGDRDKADLAAVLNVPFYALRGNCDFSGLREAYFAAGKFNILALHGDSFFVKSDLSYLRRYAEDRNADIVLYGHSHIPSIDWFDGKLFVNPGSLCRPRDGYKPTYCVIDINGDKICPELKEFN